MGVTWPYYGLAVEVLCARPGAQYEHLSSAATRDGVPDMRVKITGFPAGGRENYVPRLARATSAFTFMPPIRLQIERCQAI